MDSTTTRLNSILAADTGDPAAALAKTQRSLLKLAFALRGQSDELDQVLLRLTNSLRSGQRDVDVTQIIDSAVSALNRGSARSDLRGAMKRFADQILAGAQQRAPVVAASRLQMARRQLSDSVDESQMQAAMSGAFDHLIDALTPHASDEHGAFASALRGMLDRLRLPDTLSESAQRLQQRLATRPSPDATEASIAIAELVNRSHDAATGEVARMSRHLQQVVSKIAQLQQQLHLINHTSDRSIRESEALNESVSGHVREIQDSVDNATDISDLRSSIAGNLQSLHQGVGEFVSSARQHRTETEELLARLNRQLTMLEGETKQLSEGLLRERENASTDALTGLPNRRALDAHVAALSQPGNRTKGEFGVVIVDIDHFKTINDRYGHQAGDRVLRGVADLLRSQLRTEDFIARYGGEEFVVVLPGATIDQATAVAERMRTHVQTCRFRSADEAVPVTVSLGVATLHGEETIESALRRADRAMYVAKNQGRNQTVRATATEAGTTASAPHSETTRQASA